MALLTWLWQEKEGVPSLYCQAGVGIQFPLQRLLTPKGMGLFVPAGWWWEFWLPALWWEHLVTAALVDPTDVTGLARWPCQRAWWKSWLSPRSLHRRSPGERRGQREGSLVTAWWGRVAWLSSWHHPVGGVGIPCYSLMTVGVQPHYSGFPGTVGVGPQCFMVFGWRDLWLAEWPVIV